MNFVNDMYDLIKLFLSHLKSSDYAENTVTSYEIHLRNFYSYCRQNDINYKTISVKNMIKYKIVITDLYAFSSVNAKLSVIRAFYNFLIDIEESQINPIRQSMYIRKDRKKPSPLKKEDEDLFIQYTEQKEKHIELGFKLLFDTGIRISELVKLKKEDIKIIDNRVFIYITKSKNKKERLVPVFSNHVIEELMRYIQGHFHDTLFLYTTRAYQLHAEAFAEKFKIRFTTQMARHTFATRQLNKGMRIDVLQTILGHADIRTTMYYAMTDKTEILKLGGLFYD